MNQHKDLLYRQKYATYQLNNRTFSTQNTKISARSLAISYICFQVRIVKKKKEREKSHTINYYGKSGDSRTPGPRQGLYTRNCNWRNYSFYHSWRPSWMPLFAENSRALCPCTPPGALRRPLDPTCMRRIACFRHTRTIGLLAIIYYSFFSSFWSVCKTFFRRKSTQIFARSLRSLDIIFLKFLVF